MHLIKNYDDDDDDDNNNNNDNVIIIIIIIIIIIDIVIIIINIIITFFKSDPATVSHIIRIHFYSQIIFKAPEDQKEFFKKECVTVLPRVRY